MIKLKWVLLSLCTLLFLAACGQGESDITSGEDDATNGTEVEEQNDSDHNEEEVSEAEESQPADDEGTEEDTGTDEEIATVSNVELYFADKDLMEIFRVTTDLSVPKDETGAMTVYELWLSGPTKENLVSLVPETTIVQSVTFEEDTAFVSFNPHILDANLGSYGELMLVEQIAMLAHQFGYGKTQILVEGEVPENFLGHMDVSEPIEAKNPEDYSLAE
ncbi:GerMN domain-containing protein [Evansella tamaricis]|uniref:GerMN domain-containing protein n=1 Tax=Evansella tamaricis TaxID=2069301 RepID=A0ABS6JLT5_9BACI|nr:GerMN domain-containing protein [Evansella tamaricis]MBU9714613.1 GerMN domain-containing protein [Evansella tamaricis]